MTSYRNTGPHNPKHSPKVKGTNLFKLIWGEQRLPKRPLPQKGKAITAAGEKSMRFYIREDAFPILSTHS